MDEKRSERLQVTLARLGIASRRGVISMIEAGRVAVNDAVVREKGFRVDVSKDRISLDGKPLPLETSRNMKYFMLNKPKGVMTTLQDPHAERTIADFFRDVPERLFPVGRLDRDTTGLVLMTNDGELAFRLMHPKFGVKKRYWALVDGFVENREITVLEKGLQLEEGKTAPCEIRIEKRDPGSTSLHVVLHEGKKRQIRRIFQKVGYRVKELKRFGYGPLSLGNLKPREKRELAPREVQELREVAGTSG